MVVVVAGGGLVEGVFAHFRMWNGGWKVCI